MLVCTLRPTESHGTYSCAFLQDHAQKFCETPARFFRNAPKKFCEPRTRFFRNAPKKSARHLRVSSGTRPKNPRDIRAFLQERVRKLRESLVPFSGTRPKNPRDTHAFLQERAQKLHESLLRFFRNAPKNSAKHSCTFLENKLKNFRETRMRIFQRRAQNLNHT